MAKKQSSLLPWVTQLAGRGKNLLQIINAIRGSKGKSNVNIRYIKAAYEQYKTAKQAGYLFGGLDTKVPISKLLKENIKGGGKTVRVSFHFQFDFGKGGSKNKVGRQSVYMTMDVPSNTTKGQLMKMLKEKANDWISDHYESDPEGRASVRVMIDSIIGV